MLRAPVNLTIRNCVLSANTGGLRGGAIVFSGGVLRIDGSTVSGNVAAAMFARGGAICMDVGNVPSVATIANSMFSSNVVYTDVLNNDAFNLVQPAARSGFELPDPPPMLFGSGTGGAIFASANVSLALTISNCTFANNSATVGGAALSIPDSVGPIFLSVTGCTFTGNSAAAGNGSVAALGSNVAAVFSGCSFLRNSALNGGVFSLSGSGSSTMVIDSSLGFNSASQAGGVAVLTSASHSLNLTRSSVYGNTAFGGALAFFSAGMTTAAPLALSALTLTGNTASAGALYFSTSASVVSPPCSFCIATGNGASLYGPTIATLPTVVNASAPTAARSGRALTPVAVSLFDAYGQQVQGWPDLLVALAAPPSFGGLSGGTKVDFANGSACLTC